MLNGCKARDAFLFGYIVDFWQFVHSHVDGGIVVDGDFLNSHAGVQMDGHKAIGGHITHPSAHTTGVKIVLGVGVAWLAFLGQNNHNILMHLWWLEGDFFVFFFFNVDVYARRHKDAV